jgi:DNA-directed RNA polymerase specialized sigma24 family protein
VGSSCRFDPFLLLLGCQNCGNLVARMALSERDFPPPESFAEGDPSVFPITHWTTVLTAGHNDPTKAGEAIEKLCAKYWYPIYAFTRWRRGADHHSAEDLTQAFFEHVLHTEAFKTVDREKGKFRSFLLASLTNFLSHERQHDRAAKRGGIYGPVSWDGLTPEEKYKSEQPDCRAPEEFFDRTWAATLFEQACLRLQEEYAARGKLDRFQELKPFITEMPDDGFFDQAALRLNMRPESVRVALHRLRRELGQCLRTEIAATIGRSEYVAEELRFLMSVVGR